ncbi:efflux RND transporter permease subunit [Myxococcota bacterium]|nr:efflux RND transporter permease subunit [Myxococcota bacterium]
MSDVQTPEPPGPAPFEDKPIGEDEGGLIGLSIRRPVGVLVGIILVVLFGGLSVFGLPIQLTPDITVPTLTVTTVWPGASPSEIEREILLEQEEVLKSVVGLDRLTSESTTGSATVTLEMDVGTPIDEAIVRVSNRLAQVPRYPETAREPIITTANSAGPPLAVLAVQSTDGRDVAENRTWVEDNIVPRFERIAGVAGVRYLGGRDTEVQVRFDAARLAARGVSVGELAGAVQGELADVSGGTLDLGKRSYSVRTEVIPDPIERLESLVLRAGPDGQAVHLGDVAKVSLGLRDPERRVYSNGQEALVMIFDREAGSNVLEVTEKILAETKSTNEELLAPKGLELLVLSDQVDYIKGALRLVRNNIIIGGLLAAGVLYAFLRSFSTSAVIAATIPLCVAATTLGMSLLGRTVNVVSLAGVAFAVGMVVDNAIVVLENIETWRAKGVSAPRAAMNATREVWAALVASTLTTVAVFLPILGWRDEVGELLRDVATAVTLAVSSSLIAAVLVVPSLAARLPNPTAAPADATLGPAERLRAAIGRQVKGIAGSKAKALGVSLVAVLGSALATAALVPPMEYLPTGNRNFLFGIMVPPPGYSIDEMSAVGAHVHGKVAAHIGKAGDGAPSVGRTFFAALPNQGFMGASAEKDEDIGALVNYVKGVMKEVPGVFGVASQASLFGRNIGSGRAIDVEISGADMEALIRIGGRIMGGVQTALPGAQARPLPSLDLGGPELRITPRREDARRLGLNGAAVGVAVDALVKGRILGELGQEGEPKVDVVLVAQAEPTSPQGLMSSPIATPSGQVVPLSAVANLDETISPVTIRRVERRRAITIQVSPPDDVAVEEALDRIKSEILAPMVAEGAIPEGVQIELAGLADQLGDAQLRLAQALGLAVLICFLLLAALLDDFVSPLVIMITVPMASAGGLLALKVVNLTLSPQPLDMLTAMGFIILIGTVVNNAILIVDGALERLRAGEAIDDAVSEAVTSRVRPILMSTSTSLVGLLPLVLAPGSGSELYRGVGAVVLGGLALSTLVSLFAVPALFSLVAHLRRGA